MYIVYYYIIYYLLLISFLIKQYECIEAPFEYQSEQVSWWDDRNENQQFFWSGKYTSPNAHTCECGIYGNCVGGGTKKCNCDSGLKDLQVDSGEYIY